MSSIRTGFSWQVLLFTAAILLALAGCQPAQQPTAAPTEAATSIPTVEQAYPPAEQAYPAVQEGYPAPGQVAAGDEAYPAPGEVGTFPGMVPARENRSKVTAQLVSAQPDPARPEYTRLRVRLLASEATEGMDSVTDGLVNQEVDLLIEAAQLPDLEPGDTFEAEVSFMGDERGAAYYILKLLKTLE